MGLFIAFYGSQAAGLLLMDRAQGRPAREVFDAVISAAKAGELDHAIEVAKGEDKKPKRKAA